MSPQIIELLIFAVIAFFLINKLLSVLGTTNTDENYEKSYFGEKSNMKDITTHNEVLTTIDPTQENINNLIITTNTNSIMQNYLVLKNKIPDFDLPQFINNTKAVFKMLIDATKENNTETINHLVDKRYIKQSAEILAKYGTYNDKGELDTKVSELYMFGNNVFIKVLFLGKNIVSNFPSISEEWTFSRNTNTNSRTWYLSNIESVQLQ